MSMPTVTATKPNEPPTISAADVQVDPMFAMLLPRSAAEQYQCCPCEISGNVLTVAMMDPGDVILIDEISRVTGHRVKPASITPTDLRILIGKVYAGGAGLMDVQGGDFVSDTTSKSNTIVLGGIPTTLDAPAIVLLNDILQQAIQQRASDIHIEPYEMQCLVRFRIDGVLYDHRPMRPDEHIPLLSRIKILANLDIAEHRLPLDGRFTVNLGGKRWDIRVSTIPTQFGEKAVMRLLAKDGTTLGLEELGMLERDRRIFEQIISKPYGMLLVSGPTGSG